MFKLLSLISLLLAGLSACTSNFVPSEVGPNGEYLGWHCEGDVDSQEDWRCTKKTMKNGVLVTAPVSEKPAIEQQSIIKAPVPVAMSAPVPETVMEDQPALDDGAFTIQLGAFGNRQIAASVMEDLALDGDIQIVDILVNGQRFSALILGQYSSREEALLVADRLSERQVSFWIRSMRSLRDAAVR